VRRIISYGLIAGLRRDEMMEMVPGEILDHFIRRREYDDQQHNIRRE
jgi:hypothetical protein